MKARFPLLLLLASSLPAAACSSSIKTEPPGVETPPPSTPAAASASTCGPEPTPRCAPARHVASASELAAIVAQIAWQSVSSSVAHVLSVSDDLVADVDLDVDAASLEGPSGCTKSDDDAGFVVCESLLFSESPFPHDVARDLIAGVTCTARRSGGSPRLFGTCSRVVIAQGTTFRLRGVEEDLHPFPAGAFLEIHPACAAACPTGTSRCAATQTCFKPGYDECAYCEGAPRETCACRNETCGTRVDGAECNYASSPDYEVLGKCHAGKCSASN